MAGECTVNDPIRGILHGAGTTVIQIQVDCVGDASTGSFPDTVIPGVGGNLRAVYVVPGTTTVPTNELDLTVELGDTGYDLLGGQGADLSTSENSPITPCLGTDIYAPAPFAGTITQKISGNYVASATLTLVYIFEP